ncbi:MFS transporter [Sphaerisporangium krabiense]|uniref:MFS family permease n=1 Tax=Sphaerisporangium krabiense TaxID=763782 RepID=A0A7W9DS24_9ACTN|nr:MFS transporter [Sphaerisporangium krabiense]MBB5629078.1 MFS family permease [Sphaerisporangium krabiense]GII60083.1 MFS transporter [Sphaerisporangium krabiense]
MTTRTHSPRGKPSSLLGSRIGGFPRAFWVLFGGTFVNRLGTMVEPFIGVYLTQARGMSLATAGLVMAVFGVGSLFSQLVAGWLADHVGRRATLAGGMVATAACMILLGYSTSLPAIVAVMAVLGLVVDAYRPASQALVADLIPAHDRPRAFGLLFWAINLGFAVAMVAGGSLAREGFVWLFWIDAVSSLIFGFLVWRAVPETRPARSAQAGGFREALKDRLMVVFVVTSLLYAFVYLQAYTTLPLAITGQGLSTTAYGLAISVNGILIVLVQPLVGPWLNRHDPGRTLAVGMAVVGAGFALTALVSTTAGYAAAVAVWTLGEVVTAGMAGAVVAALAPPHLRGRYSGLFGFAWSAGGLLAPLAGTRLLAVGHEVLWVSVGAVGLVAAAGQLAIAPAIRRRSAA